MHELSVVQSVIDIIKKELEQHPPCTVKTVTLQCGSLSGVVVDSLNFAWEALSPNTFLENSKLEVNIVALKVACAECKFEFEPKNQYTMNCPECDTSFGHTILNGKELNIENIEVDEIE